MMLSTAVPNSSLFFPPTQWNLPRSEVSCVPHWMNINRSYPSFTRDVGFPGSYGQFNMLISHHVVQMMKLLSGSYCVLWQPLLLTQAWWRNKPRPLIGRSYVG